MSKPSVRLKRAIERMMRQLAVSASAPTPSDGPPKLKLVAGPQPPEDG